MNWDNVEKSTGGWEYNEVNLTYNQETDPDSGNIVLYNSMGGEITFTNEDKTT